MFLRCIGSSSKGNGYALIAENETLLLEAGVPFTAVNKAIDFEPSNVIGCLISHEHG